MYIGNSLGKVETLHEEKLFSSSFVIFGFLFYFFILSFVSFYHNPMTLSWGDPVAFFAAFWPGDSLKFITYAARSLHEGFLCPKSHCPGLEVIDIILLWIHPKFPVILFLTLFNCLLWSLLFMQLYAFGQKRINGLIAFFVPLVLLIPNFSYSYFLRGNGIHLGTSYSAVSLSIGLIFILSALQKDKILLSILAGTFFAFSAYIWSMSDKILVGISISFFICALAYFLCGLLFKGLPLFFQTMRRKTGQGEGGKYVSAPSPKLDAPLERKGRGIKRLFFRFYHFLFPIMVNLTAAFTTFWALTLPYRLYMKHLTMTTSDELWQRIWRVPLSDWLELPTSTHKLIFRTGGFPFCQAYPKICEELYKNQDLHANVSYLKKLTFQTFADDPLTLLQWKFPFLIPLWHDGDIMQNKIIFFLLFFIVILFLVKPTKTKTIILFFCCAISLMTVIMLYISHLEDRYFYIMKFTLCVGALLSFYASIPLKTKRTSFKDDLSSFALFIRA